MTLPSTPPASELQAVFDKILVQFRNGHYETALGQFQHFVRCEEITELHELRARRNIASCLLELAERGNARDRDGDLFYQNLDRYLQLLACVPQQNVAAIPTLDYFEDSLKYSKHIAETTNRGELATSYLQRFLDAAQTKVGRKELVDRAIKVVELMRRDVEHPCNDIIAQQIAEGILQAIPEGQLLAQKAMLFNLLADLAYFFPKSGEDEQQRYQRVLDYLDAALRVRPQDPYAQRMTLHVQRLAATTLQIKRFGHDTRNRMGNIRQIMKQLLKQTAQQSDAQRLALQLDRQFRDLLLVQQVVEGQQPSPEQWKQEDPVKIVGAKLQAYGWSPECVEIIGEPAAWEFCPDLLGLALENLFRNSAEAYERRKITPPLLPLTVTIDYQQCKLIVSDQAGGVDPALGDIFAPFASSKPVKGNTGLGLTQAADAVRAQHKTFTLSLSQVQPPQGAAFEIALPKLD